MIQLVDHIGQTDRVNIENGRRIRIRPHLRRIAGNDQKIAQAQRRRAEQIRLHSEQVSVATAVMRDGFDADLLLDDQWKRPGPPCAIERAGRPEH